MRRPILHLLAFAVGLMVTGAVVGQDDPEKPTQNPSPEELRALAEEADGLLKDLLGAQPGPLDDARIAGLPAGSKPEALTWPRAYALASIRARDANAPRSEALDANQLAARSRDLGVDDFARFRDGLARDRAFRDPAADLLDLQSRLVAIENSRREVAYIEKWWKTLGDLVRGEASQINQTDFDQLDLTLSEARRRLARQVADYRDRLDALKVALGLSPHAPVTIDLAPLSTFRAAFESFDRWSLSTRRELEELDRLAGRLPSAGDVTIEGRSILDEVGGDPGRLEEVLSLATRAALRDRRDGEGRDVVELRVRRRLRHLIEIRADYEHERRTSTQAVRRMSDAFEQIIAPPTNTTGNSGRPGQMVLGLSEKMRQIAENRSRLVALWATFRAERHALHRDLGMVPFDDWSSFYGQFAAHPSVREEARPEGPAPPPARPAKPRDD